MRQLFLFFTLYILPQLGITQTSSISAKIIDKETGVAIPYATIVIGEADGVISNGEGLFSISNPKTITDSLHISSMGYEKQSFLIKNMDSIIALTPKSFELSTVFVSNKNLPVAEIIKKAKDYMPKNHWYDYHKKQFFYRASFTQKYAKMDFGFQKSSIEAIDKQLIDSIAQSIPNDVSYFFETLCESYGNYQPEFKLNILKALNLEDESQATTFTGFQEKMEQLLKENVKPDSYLKIKSGIVGTKIPLDSIIEDQKIKDARKKRYETKEYFNYRKASIHQVLDQLFYHKKSDIDVIQNTKRYEFELIEYQEIGENLAYVLTFVPKGSADFKGKLYINTDDFAILRLDYENAKPVYDKLFNMFGIHANKIRYRGTMLFEKSTTDNYYHIKYANQELGESLAIKRPLRIIEKNKFVRGRRKQNEVKLELDLKMYNTIKRELVVYKNTPVSASTLENYQEDKKIKIHKASRYDPTFWEGHTVLEPNQLIREYKAMESE